MRTGQSILIEGLYLTLRMSAFSTIARQGEKVIVEGLQRVRSGQTGTFGRTGFSADLSLNISPGETT